MEPVQLAAILATAVVLASMISVEVGISVALIELALGVLAGNLFHLNANEPWLVFVASFASIVLTFLAGAEVDPDDFRDRFAASIGIGVVSFGGPFVVAGAVAYGLLGWTLDASLIAGTALDHVPGRRLCRARRDRPEQHPRGQADHERLLRDRHGHRARAVGDLHQAERLVPVFLVVSVVLIVALPKIAPWFFRRYGDRVIEPRSSWCSSACSR